MKKKKIIIVSIFLALIVLTSFAFLKGAIESYNYDMDPTNGIDVMEGMGAVILIVLGGVVVLYEFDLFYTVYYFFIRPKTVVRSVLNILANISLLLVFFNKYYKDIFDEDVIAPFCVFAIYIVLRISYFMIGVNTSNSQQDEAE